MAKQPGKKSKRKSSTPAASHVVQSGGIRALFGAHLLALLLVVITAAAMSPVVFNDYITLDDEQFITSNPIVQDGDVAKALRKQLYSPHYKPLVYLGWIAEVAVFGNNPHVMHFNNLLLHLVSTVLVFFFMLRLAQYWPVTKPHDKAIAFFSALLFGIHPLHVESVAWAIERKDVLFGVFYVGGLLSYIKYVQQGQKKYLYFTAALYMLSLLSKSMGITLVGVVFLIDWAAGRRNWKELIIEKWPLYIPLLISLVLYGIIYHPRKTGTSLANFTEVASPPDNIADLPGFYQRIIIAAFRYCFFVIHTLVPAKLALVYPREPILGWAGPFIHLALVIAGLLASLPLIWKKHRDLLITGIGFFTMSILPILVEEGPGTNFGSDRYTYIPSIGMFLLISAFACHYLPQKTGKWTAGQLVLAAYCAILAVGTFFQARKWGDSYALYDQAVNNYAMNWVAMHYRGGANEDRGDIDAALADFSRSIEMDPSRFRPWFARGTLYLKLQKYNEAIHDFTMTLERNPTYEKAWVNRGNAYRDLNQNDNAILDYNEALRIQKNFDKALNNRGAAYLKKGMYDEALADFNRVLELDPRYINGYINRAALYINANVKKYDLAIRDYDTALQLDPNNVQARYFRGVAMRSMGRNAEALEDVNRAIALSPNTAVYYFTRAQILRSLGRNAESQQDARRAQQLGYKVPADYLQ